MYVLSVAGLHRHSGAACWTPRAKDMDPFHTRAKQVEWTAPEPLEDLDTASQGDGETRAYVRAYYASTPGLYAQSEVFVLESATASSA